MAEVTPAGLASNPLPSPSPLPPPPKHNPAFKALGLPSFRAKLPSRNWLIFIGIVSTWTGLVVYDRREKKRIRSEWCQKVAHLAEQPLPPMILPRKIKIYLSAPPGDGITAARDYFKEYVKPVLVAAAVDYDVVEGRRAGEVRVNVAEHIRKWRKRHGEINENPEDAATAEAPQDGDDEVEKIRQRIGVTRETPDESSGILLVGRHTWKEFLRGVHEGWLGPLEVPPPLSKSPAQASESESDDLSTSKPLPSKEKPRIPPPTVNAEDYHNTRLSASFPHASNSLPLSSPTTVIPFPHLLGFLNTPIRIYRYLTQRHLMARTCREAAALCLGFNRPFYAFIPDPLLPDSTINPMSRNTTIDSIDSNVLDAASGRVNSGDMGTGGEIDVGTYPEEESDWPKKYRNPLPPAKEDVEEVETDEDTKANDNIRLRRAHREWGGKVTVDGRVAGRMRKYDIPVADGFDDLEPIS